MPNEMGLKLDKPASTILRRAEALANDPSFLAAFRDAFMDPKLRESALKDPHKYLRSKDVKLPTSLNVVFSKKLSLTKPSIPDVPDNPYWFSIRLVECRTVWLRKSGLKNIYEQVQICLGFEITRRTGSPIG